MWNPDGHRLPSWIEDAYEGLAPEILAHEDGMPQAKAERVLTECEDLELSLTDAEHAVDQLLEQGYLYEVRGVLFITDAER